MNVFVAGATGAIGRPLIAELIRNGHAVTGMTRSTTGADRLAALGATIAIVDAFDPVAVESALRHSRAEIVIDQLTALPRDPADFATAFPGDRKLRLEGGGNLHRAAQATGVRRYIQQASGFFLKARKRLADESDELATDASPGIAASAQMYAEIEARLWSSPEMESVTLRYGFFYGPGTWYARDGAAAAHVRNQQTPITGDGSGVWSWVHIEDAARATVAALTVPSGIYNIVDDNPSPLSSWLPAFAQWLGAPPPLHATVQETREAAGEDAVYYATRLNGASNEKVKHTLGFQPRLLEWLTDFPNDKQTPSTKELRNS